MSGSKTRPLTDEERRVVKALKRLSKKWPESLWLFAGNGDLCVMQCNRDGDHAMTDAGGVDPEYCIADIDIPNDGGGW